MNKLETAEVIKVMQAFVDGEEIEWRGVGAAIWRQDFIDQDKPAWDWGASEYRIKPREPREFWVTISKTGNMEVHRRTDSLWASLDVESIKVREIVE